MQQIRVDGKDSRDFLDGTSGGINEEFETGYSRPSMPPESLAIHNDYSHIEPESDDEEA
jgi:hypothetical protein